MYDYNQTKIRYHSLCENYKNLKELKDLELQIKNDKLNTKDQELQKLDIEITNKKNYIKILKTEYDNINSKLQNINIQLDLLKKKEIEQIKKYNALQK